MIIHSRVPRKRLVTSLISVFEILTTFWIENRIRPNSNIIFVHLISKISLLSQVVCDNFSKCVSDTLIRGYKKVENC